MRLDKFIANQTHLTRSEAIVAIKFGRVAVDNKIVKISEQKIDENSQIVTLDGKQIVYKKFVYLMLNKPDGIVSSTDDGDGKTVVDLLPEYYQKREVFPCGRLDKNTLGLIILTDDGESSHKLLSPKTHAEKVYKFVCKFPLSENDLIVLQNGVDIGGYITMPCKITLDDERSGKIVLTEGKYHQIKLMFQQVHNQIIYLERIAFAGICLDENLERGKWRELNEDEIKLFTKK